MQKDVTLEHEQRTLDHLSLVECLYVGVIQSPAALPGCRYTFQIFDFV